MTPKETTALTAKEHECTFNVDKYARDDQGFYLDCTQCGRMRFFAVNTLEELYELFGINDDD